VCYEAAILATGPPSHVSTENPGGFPGPNITELPSTCCLRICTVHRRSNVPPLYCGQVFESGNPPYGSPGEFRPSRFPDACECSYTPGRYPGNEHMDSMYLLPNAVSCGIMKMPRAFVLRTVAICPCHNTDFLNEGLPEVYSPVYFHPVPARPEIPAAATCPNVEKPGQGGNPGFSANVLREAPDRFRAGGPGIARGPCGGCNGRAVERIARLQ